VGTPVAVHRARVLIRRYREWLPAVAGRRAGPLVDDLQRVRRLLGPVRELDVCLTILEDLPASAGASATARRALVRVCRAARRRHLAAVRTAVGEEVIASLETRLDDAASTGASRRRPPSKVVLRRRVRRRARRLSEATRHAAGLYLPERLHDVRIRLKKLRYAIEAASEVRALRIAKTDRALIRRAQDILGRMQDLEVVIEQVRAAQGTPGTLTLRTSRSADVVVRHLERRCRDLHVNYVALRDDLDACCRAVRQRARG
jgi:CHAD domain-containing protein